MEEVIKKQKQEEKNKRKENEKRWMIISLALERILGRQIRQKDPVIRYTLLINNFILGLDTFSAYVYSEIEGMSPEIKNKITENIENISKEFDLMMDWIQSPHYGPDHPVGKVMMESSIRDVEQNLRETNEIKQK